MKILLEIPDAFAEHFAMDKFKDSFMRICGDLGEIAKSHSRPGAASLGLSGRYEKELVDVLAPAFVGASVVENAKQRRSKFTRLVDAEHAKRGRQVLQAEQRRAFTEVQFWDTIVQGFPQHKNHYFDRLHGINYSQSYKGRTPAEWLEYWRRRAARVCTWLRDFKVARRKKKFTKKSLPI